mmetsp:Transcript_84756/g.182760  ORF Transcript_84756/g.182760 Transcript_84756/m.182760 type:complete len:660 (-) Transcript_84756:32-2011(-)
MPGSQGLAGLAAEPPAGMAARSSDTTAEAAEVLSRFFDGREASDAPPPVDASDRQVCPAEDGDGEVPGLAWNPYDHSLRRAMAERRKAQREREREAEEKMFEKHQEERQAKAEAKAGPPVVGSVFIPREAYNLVQFRQQSDLVVATFWNSAHSWQGNFGLWGMDAEGEDPRVRVLVTQSSPAVVLMELNSLATFNMLDPVIGFDMGMMHDTVNQCLLKRDRHSHGYPLGFVLQGVGPHFCPGGNHHPVSPHGATPLQMSTHSSALINARFREHSMPGITAITGSAVGGGVAIATLTTQRVCASNASMAFGNLSRGASPMMWLSKNLPNEVGMSAAISIYLEDRTAGAYGCVKSGLAMAVAPNLAATKARALTIVKNIAQLPSARLLAHQHCQFDLFQFNADNAAFMFNSLSGQMFSNVKGAAKKKKAVAAHETLALDSSGSKEPASLGQRPWEGDGDVESQEQLLQQRKTVRERGATQGGAAPQPFPDHIGAQPIRVGAYDDASCGQCGSRGMDGTIYGDVFYCRTCWPRMGLDPAEASATDEEAGAAPAGRVATRRSAAARGPHASQKVAGDVHQACTWCGKFSPGGQWGRGAYAWNYYCPPCWGQWQGPPGAAPGGAAGGNGFSTDISTDVTDSGTEGTVFDSDGICFTDGSDSEWW